MELGNMFFGNSRGEFPIEARLSFEEIFSTLTTKLFPDNYYVGDFTNDTFITRPYYWGDCSCGYADKEWALASVTKHSRFCYQEDYIKLKKWKKDNKGTDKDFDKYLLVLLKKHKIHYDESNIHLGSALHCTCHYNTVWHEFEEANHHANDCRILLPNFEFFETGLTISWYKYPFRDSYSSKPISTIEFSEIIKKCIESLDS